MRLFKSESIINKVLFLVIASTVAPVLVGIGYSIYESRNSEVKIAGETTAYNRTQLQNAFETFNRGFKVFRVTPSVEGIVRAYENENIDPFDGSDTLQWKSRFGETGSGFLSNYDSFEKVDFVHENGEILGRIYRDGENIVSATPDQLANLINDNDQELVDNALDADIEEEGNRIFFSKSYEWEGKECVQLAMPVYDRKGYVKGVKAALVLTIPFSHFLNIFFEDYGTEGGTEALIDSDRETLFSRSGKNRQWASTEPVSMPNDVYAGLQFREKSVIEKDGYYYLASAPIYPTPEKNYTWSYVYKVPTDTLFSSSIQKSNTLILIMLGVVCVAIFAGVILSRRLAVSSEIKELSSQCSEATEKIADCINHMQRNTDEAVQDIRKIIGSIQDVTEVSMTIATTDSDREEISSQAEAMASNSGEAEIRT